MNRNTKILAGLAFAAAALGTALYISRKLKTRKRLAAVSDAGYETAYDIHFPLRHNRLSGASSYLRSR